MGNIQRNLKALRDIVDNTTPMELCQVSSIRKLIENTMFSLQTRHIYDKYKDKCICKRPIKEIINFKYDDVLPEEFWVKHNKDGTIAKIQPAVCLMTFSDIKDTKLDKIRKMLSELTELINYYNHDGFKFKTKCDWYYKDDKLIGFYVYTTININK